MANFKITTTLLCVLLIGQEALAVINKGPAQSTTNKDTTETKDQAVAEDRILSDVYGAPGQLSNDYGPPLGGGGLNGPPPVYGPPELTGHHGPVQVHPPPPPELPPPPPHSYGPPRKPKPHYGPPKPTYGPPLQGFGPKPNYGPPKLHFGPAATSFGSSRPPKPQYGPPLKFSGPPNHQFGPPRFGGPKPIGHGLTIPISIETYGPPSKGALLPFDSSPQKEYGPPLAPIPLPQGQYGPPAGDLYGPPPPPPPPGIPAPPTPPDIKYDGWQPIAGLVGAPNHHGPSADHHGSSIENHGPPPNHQGQLDNSYGPPDNSYGPPNSGNGQVHISSGQSSVVIANSGKHNLGVPSNSYGEPLHNPDAQNLQSSVHQATNSHGLPPPPLPQSEPLHNNQGPAQSLPGHNEQHQHHDSNTQSHQFGTSDPTAPQYDFPIGGDLKVPAFEILPETGALIGNSHENSFVSNFGSSSASSSSFAGSSSNNFHSDISSSLSLPVLPHESYGTPLTSVGNHHVSHNSHGGGDDFTLQKLPFNEPSTTFTSSFSSGLLRNPGNGHSLLHTQSGHGHGQGHHTLTLSAPAPTDSYGAPPSSSFSSSGPYPSSHSSRGVGSWLSAFNLFGSSNSQKHHSSGFHHHHHKNHGPPPLRYSSPPAMTAFLIPPRNRAPLKFREPIPSSLLTNLNRYLPPVSKPLINYGAPAHQELPSFKQPLSFKSASSNSFANSFASDASFAKDNSFTLNSPIAAPNVHYGTPLSFNDFNTPAPVLTYGAPNFGPANSFISTTFGGFGGNSGNLYNSIASNAVATTYGTPVQGGGAFLGGHDCAFQKSGGSGFGQYNSFVEEAGHRANNAGGHHQSFANSEQSSGAISSTSHGHSSSHLNHEQNHQQQQNFVNSEQSNSHQQFTNFPPPSINELDLESHEQQQGDLKDSYGNPIGLGLDNHDQTGAALTTNDIHLNTVVSSSSGYSSHGAQHSQHQNSYIPPVTFSNGDGASAEALTAALTAQSYGQGKNYASNELAQDTSSQYTKIHEGSNDALALALQAEGADGFQIQGSKGTYTLQIHAADGGLGTENSDGTIRHDQVLSNGLLQDILAAIEQPGDGPVQIQGPPQPQHLQEVYDEAVANSAHHQQHVNVHHHEQDSVGSHNEIVQQVLTVQGNDDRIIDHEKSHGGEKQVALFYDNGNYEDTNKEIRSTSKSEGQAALTSHENSSEQSNSRADSTKKSS